MRLKISFWKLHCHGIEADRIQECVIHRTVQHPNGASERKLSVDWLFPQTMEDVQTATAKNHQQNLHPSGIVSTPATIKILILVWKKRIPRDSDVLDVLSNFGFPQNSHIILVMFPLWLLKPWYSSGTAPIPPWEALRSVVCNLLESARSSLMPWLHGKIMGKAPINGGFKMNVTNGKTVDQWGRFKIATFDYQGVKRGWHWWHQHEQMQGRREPEKSLLDIWNSDPGYMSKWWFPETGYPPVIIHL